MEVEPLRIGRREARLGALAVGTPFRAELGATERQGGALGRVLCLLGAASCHLLFDGLGREVIVEVESSGQSVRSAARVALGALVGCSFWFFPIHDPRAPDR